MDSADFDALEEKARAGLSPAAYAFAAAGADDEITVADNIAAWRRLRLRPRMLNDVTQVDTGVSILGVRCNAPIMVAPFGRHKLFHPEGERATARGAAAAGAVFVLPTTSTVSIEEERVTGCFRSEPLRFGTIDVSHDRYSGNFRRASSQIGVTARSPPSICASEG